MTKSRYKNNFDKLPESVQNKAYVDLNGDYGWHLEDFEEAIDAGSAAGLASRGGEVEFHLPGSIMEVYWLNTEGLDWLFGEPWKTYVALSASEVKRHFRHICATTDFLAEARKWSEIKYKIDEENLDPLKVLIFKNIFFDQDGIYQHYPKESKISTMTFQTIVEEIMATHHSLLKRELPKLSTLFAELAAHDPHNSAIAEAQQIYTKVRNKVETHLRDEETALFPNGIALERGGNVVGTEFDQEQRLDEMEKEHDGCGKTLTSIQQMLQTAVPASELRDQIITNIQIIQDDFVAHVEKENTIVHPMLREFLTARQSSGN